MEKQFAGKGGTGKTSTMGGAKAAANIINLLEPSQEGMIMEQIAKADQVLGARIQDLVFVFDNLLELDDRSMQELMRQVPSDRLLLALKGADEPLKEKIFKNMSQRASEMLKDDLEAKGPVRISEVEGAQKEILQIARKLAESGAIALAGKGEAYV
jgi:flagellar motor switch protein FliG